MWKYSIAVHGTVDELMGFTKELESFGYCPSILINSPQPGDVLLTRRNPNSCIDGYDFFSANSLRIPQAGAHHTYLPRERDLSLSLAAVQDDEEPHIGELWFSKVGQRYCVLSRGTGRRLSDGAILSLEELGGRKATMVEILEFHQGHDKPADGHAEAPKESRKIIGYKAPAGLYSGLIKAGAVYEKACGVDDIPILYAPIGVEAETKPAFSLPAEIVEKWEPVYEEQEVVLERNGFLITISKKGIRIKKFNPGEKERWIKVEDLRQISGFYTSLYYWQRYDSQDHKIGLEEWKVSPETVTIGCTSGFRVADIEEALRIFDGMGGQEL